MGPSWGRAGLVAALEDLGDDLNPRSLERDFADSITCVIREVTEQTCYIGRVVPLLWEPTNETPETLEACKT